MKNCELLFLTIISLTLLSCNSFNKTKNAINAKNPANNYFSDEVITSNYDTIGINNALDLLLSCNDFSYFETDSIPSRGYYRIPYNGCLYNPSSNFDNKLGWADIILIPKKSYRKYFSNINDNNKIDSVTEVVNNMHLDELKIKFNSIIFLIEKKYLYYSENVDINYYPKLPYVKKLFLHEDCFKNWELVDSIEIHNEVEDIQWINTKLLKILND